MSSIPAGNFDRDTLRRLAGHRSFERGEEYFASGQVRSLVEYAGNITARVLGSREYRVKLYVEEDALEYSCTCPVGCDGLFCKHCVAVGLAWLEQTSSGETGSGDAIPALTMDDVRAYLLEQDGETLTEIIMQQALEDERLRRQLLVKAAKGKPRGLVLESYRAAIREAIEVDEFVSYYDMASYTLGLEESVDLLQELLAEGHAAAVIDLSEYALSLLEEAFESVHDSDGYLGHYSEKLQELHHAACGKARPDPEELAERLFEWELDTAWNTFYGAVETYEAILSEEGLAAYRELAGAEWARVPSLGPGDRDEERYGKRFRITRIVESLARLTGDIEELVEVKKRDLSSQYQFLEIAEIYGQAEKHDLALEWAERGLRSFPERADSRLREFLAQEYHRRKRHDEAMALVWDEFADSPHLEKYKYLKSHADRIGQWQVWRDKALAYMRERLVEKKRESQTNRWGGYWRMDHSELVKVFLEEKDVEAAWSEAGEGGCGSDLWMRLADLRQKKYPEDSLQVYTAQVDPLINRKNNDAYAEAVELLRKIHAVMARLGREAEFKLYLDSVRATHKRKRNLIKLLDKEAWG